MAVSVEVVRRVKFGNAQTPRRVKSHDSNIVTRRSRHNRSSLFFLELY